MAYEVTATRKRPHSFDSLVGQEFVVATLANALSSGRIANAFLFSGPRGVGKTSAARILARALNCPSGPTGDSCEDYPGADDIAKGRAIDVIEIDGASNTSVNDIRAIKDEILFPPQSARFKIYIIDEVHMLSNSAFNALLKTIEEPPPYIKFIFATTEIHKVPATIRSRCQQFNFRLIPLELIKQKLSEACVDVGVRADDEALFWIAKEGTGSLRDAYTLLDQVLAFSGDHVSLEGIREKLGFIGLEVLGQLADAAVRGSTNEVLEKLDGIFQSGISIEQCIIDLAEYYRAVLFLQAGIRREALLGASPERFADNVVHGYTRGQLERIVSMFLQLYRDVRYSLDPRCELELAIARLSRMRMSLDSQEIAERFEQLEQHYLRASHVETVVASPVESVRMVEKPVPAQLETSIAKPETVQAATIFPADKQAFFERIRKEQQMLSGVIEKAREIVVRETMLYLLFDDAYPAEKAKEERSVIIQIAQQVWPQVVGVEVEVSSREKTLEPKTVEYDDATRQAIEIFRGEVVSKLETAPGV